MGVHKGAHFQLTKKIFTCVAPGRDGSRAVLGTTQKWDGSESRPYLIDKLQGGHLGHQSHRRRRRSPPYNRRGAIGFARVPSQRRRSSCFCSKEVVNANSYGAPQNPTDAQ